MDQVQTSALRNIEASLLGGILLRNETLGELPNLAVEDFYDPRHRIVFAAMRDLEAANRPIDVVTVQHRIAERGINAVDFAFLGELALSVPIVDNVMDYARQIRSASVGRRVRIALSEVLEESKRLELSGEEMLSAAMARLSSVDDEQPDETKPISTVLKGRFKQLIRIMDEREKGSQSLTGFPTGVDRLDEKLGGWQPGIVTIVAARPGMGKSSLGLATADACSAGGFGAHLFSLEDTEESYADRAISRASGVPAENMRNAQLNRNEPDKLVRAMVTLNGRRWLVDGRSGTTADEIVRSVRRHRRQNGTCVVIVDYVQLVKRSNPRHSSHEALTEIVTTFADAAKQDRLAYVVMSQLNRGVEQRQDKRPQLSDLRESGSLEERAKCVVALYRGSVYGPAVKGIDWDPSWKGRDWAPNEDEHREQVQLLVLKNSNGRTGTVWAHWNGPTTRIS